MTITMSPLPGKTKRDLNSEQVLEELENVTDSLKESLARLKKIYEEEYANQPDEAEEPDSGDPTRQ